MVRPRNPRAVGGSGLTKAPKLPQSKAKKRNIVGAAEEGGEDVNAGTDPNRRAARGRTRSKKQQRSVLGFVIGVGACLALWGWSLVHGAAKRRRDRGILDSMARKPLSITDHAACRMDCRFISREHIHAMLAKGRIHDGKSDPALRPCPKYVVDADVTTKSGAKKTVEGVFAACRNETRVLTVIDIETNWPCGPC